MTSHTVLALVATVALSACARDEEAAEKKSVDPPTLQAAKACYAASGEARRTFMTAQSAQSVEEMISAESIIAQRRHDEQVCLAEAECLKIKQAYRGKYLKTCVAKYEGDT